MGTLALLRQRAKIAGRDVLGGGGEKRFFDVRQKKFFERSLQFRKVKSEYVTDDVMAHVFAALMPANALALRVSDATGLRIGDVLAIKRSICFVVIVFLFVNLKRERSVLFISHALYMRL